MDSANVHFPTCTLTAQMRNVGASIFDKGGFDASTLKYQADFSPDWSSPFVDDDDDDESTGFLRLPVDGETTEEPASDDHDGGCHIASSSSDEDTECQAPWAHPGASWKMGMKAEPALPTQGAARSGETLRNLLARAPPPFPSQAAPEAPQPSSATRELLPEEGLVDIDPEEGQRRGGELMAMLRESEGTSSRQERPATPKICSSVHSTAACWSALSAAATPFVLPEATYPELHSETWGDHTLALKHRHAVAIQQAAHDAFGSLLKEVAMDADGTYFIYLHQGLREYNEVPVLSILSRALWPLLGREVAALQSTVGGGIGERRPRLVMRVVGDGITQDSQFCWEFATTGTCPRGSRCRWEHNSLAISLSNIEIVY